MKIAVVLPTSNHKLLADRQSVYNGLASSDTRIIISLLDKRVPLEADASDSFILPEILHNVIELEEAGMDAVVIDCMEDPGVEEARRHVSIPVIGPGQAAMSLAVMLGCKFSILYPMQQRILIEKLVQRLQLTSMLASIRFLAVGLDGIKLDDKATLTCLKETAMSSIAEDGAHVIIPACTLTSHLVKPLQKYLHQQGFKVPVIDGPAAAIKSAENFVELQISPSRITYPSPLGIKQRVP